LLLEELLATTKTRIVILSERTMTECSSLIPMHWCQKLGMDVVASKAGRMEIRIETMFKLDLLRGVARESVGLPYAYLGCEPSDEDAFRGLGSSALGVLFWPELCPTSAHVLVTSAGEVQIFMEKWLYTCRAAGAAA